MTKSEQFKQLTIGEKLSKSEVLGVFILEQLEEISAQLTKLAIIPEKPKPKRRKSLITRKRT